MAQTWQQTDTAADHSGLKCYSSNALATGVDYRECAVGGSAGSSNVSATITAASTEVALVFEGDQGMGVTSVPSGTWTVNVYNAASQSDCNIVRIDICAVNSDGSNDGTIATWTGSTNLSTTGNKQFSVTQGSSYSCETTDRFYIQIHCQNTHGKQPRDVTFTPSQTIVDTIAAADNLTATELTLSQLDLSDDPTFEGIVALTASELTLAQIDLSDDPTLAAVPTLTATELTLSQIDLSDDPTLTSTAALTATELTLSQIDLSDEPTLGIAGTTDDLTAQELTLAQLDLTDEPTLTSTADLTATELTLSQIDLSDDPTITSTAALTATELTLTQIDLTDEPTITSTADLTATELTLSQLDLTDEPTLAEVGGTDNLTASELTLSELDLSDDPTLAAIPTLTASQLTLAQLDLEDPTFGQIHALDADELTLAMLSLDDPYLTSGNRALHFKYRDGITGSIWRYKMISIPAGD